MEVKAKVKFIKMSPRKVRLVADVIRELKVADAFNQLNNLQKKAAKPVEKLIKSAIANATNNYELEESNLFIKEVSVDEGPTLHRWKPRARGRATPIRKRTSHINLVLGELVESGISEAKKQDIDEPIKLGTRQKEAEGVKVKDKSSDTKAREDKKAAGEKGKKVIDSRGEGHGKHSKIEGKSSKGFIGKMFRRKSG